MPLAHFKKGTTTMAFMYKPKTEKDKGGILVAVDSRASGGDYVCKYQNRNINEIAISKYFNVFLATKDVMKILSINERMVATMAGGAADCQFWVQQVSKYCK
jgi:20S proteasome subunit beta 5